MLKIKIKSFDEQLVGAGKSLFNYFYRKKLKNVKFYFCHSLLKPIKQIIDAIVSKKSHKKTRHLSGFFFSTVQYYAVASTLGLAFDTITIAGRIKRPFNS